MSTEPRGIGWAVKELQNGNKVCRSGWNATTQFLYFVPGNQFEINRPPLLGIYVAGTVINYLPHIDIRTADGYCVPWLCTQTDLLAIDWQIYQTKFNDEKFVTEPLQPTQKVQTND